MLARLLLLIGVTLFCAEAAGVVFFALQEGQLFYSRTRAEPSAPQPQPLAVGGEQKSPTGRIHPYLGFALRPNLSLAEYLSPQRAARLYERGEAPWLHIKTNSLGIFSDVEYPFAYDPNETYVIGILGGSVAHWFYLQGSDQLSRRLQDHPQIGSRRIKFLNLAAGGYKQPQQLLVFSYLVSLGQRFDALINIDGFNEVALAGLNVGQGVSVEMPSAQHIMPLIGLASADAAGSNDRMLQMAEVLQARQSLERWSACAGTAKFATRYLACDLLRRRTLYKKGAAEDALRESAASATNQGGLFMIKEGSKDGDWLTRATAVWAAGSTLLAQSSRALEIPYLHVLQPNQYFTKKPFSPDEQKIAVNADSPYRAPAVAGYPALVERGRALRASQVPFFDATAIFDSENRVVFSDDCCHFNQLGNELLADAIADAFVKQLDARAGLKSALLPASSPTKTKS